MGYDVHITRKDDWSDAEGEEISVEEWLHYVGSDKSMRLDGEAQATMDSGVAVGIKDETLAVWTEWEGRKDDVNQAWMWYARGNVMAKNPDAAMRRKMFLIADELNARLQGDEGEFYDSTGEVEGQRRGGGMGKKKWWKFW